MCYHVIVTQVLKILAACEMSCTNVTLSIFMEAYTRPYLLTLEEFCAHRVGTWRGGGDADSPRCALLLLRLAVALLLLRNNPFYLSIFNPPSNCALEEN